ncbi:MULTISPECIES: TorD/DmsD family molecular chaperone [Trueperella]|uniref:TorA maturation chaperone TorD n=1 Tax=Trueperella abortisuis TaxID=445930 RepID=A0ABT9PJU6_9ACTO|nr:MULTISPECIES: molecular chaperone TorD family protein [Trueperella]MDP9832235.1 TorA maturation chaperone TorD [Trueperella abortisuis]
MTTSWQDSLPERKVRSVQLATALYSLSRFYAEAPNREVLARFADPAMAQTWPLRDPVSLAAIAEIADGHESVYALNAEFAALIGPSGSLRLTESEFTGEDPLQLVEVLAQQYREAGYASQKTQSYPRDHVAVELGFLAHLIVASGEDERVRRFLREHLDRYVVELLDELEAHARTATYRGVVHLTRAALTRVKELTGDYE